MLAILSLALAVFGWGTRYKLSLYDPPGSPSATLPQAKLLSQRERPLPSTAVEVIRPVTLQPQPLIFLSAAFVGALAIRLQAAISFRPLAVKIDEAKQQSAIAHSTFFSFRPPPAVLLSK